MAPITMKSSARVAQVTIICLLCIDVFLLTKSNLVRPDVRRRRSLSEVFQTVKAKCSRDKLNTSEDTTESSQNRLHPYHSRLTNEISPLPSPCKTTTPPPRLEVLQELPQEGLQRSSTFRTFLEQAVDDINNKYKTTSATCLGSKTRLGSIANSEDMGSSSFYSTTCTRSTFQPRYRLPTFVERPSLPVQPASGEVQNENLQKYTAYRLPDTDKTVDISAVVASTDLECSTSAVPSLQHTTSSESSDVSEEKEEKDTSTEPVKGVHSKTATDNSFTPSSMLVEVDDADPFASQERQENVDGNEKYSMTTYAPDPKPVDSQTEECNPFSDTAHATNPEKTPATFLEEVRESSESDSETDESGYESTNEEINHANATGSLDHEPLTRNDENGTQPGRYRNCSAPSVADLVSKFRNMEQPHACRNATEQDTTVDVTEKIIKSYRRHHCDESDTSSSEDDRHMATEEENGRRVMPSASIPVGAWPSQ